MFLVLLSAALHRNVLIMLALLLAVALLHLLSTRLRISPPILLVVAGLAASLVPGMPVLALDPDLVFLIFLPPLLYEAAWHTSWRDFRRERRSIGLLAFGLVLFTALAVGWLTHALIPGCTLAMGILIGGIISPPDAVAATSVLKGLPVPKRVVTILEGESLVNDASSLIIFRFALAAILTGQFALAPAIGTFLYVAIVGVAVGLAVAGGMYLIHLRLPTTSTIDVALTLLTPHLMYLAAESVHASGVLAVVCGGLFLSHRSSDFLNYRSRIQSNGVWDTVSFVLNGLVFILIGLQLPMILRDLGMPPAPALLFAITISAAVILIRPVWVLVAAYLPRWLGLRKLPNAPPLSLKELILVSWAGMRGVVSLASALAIPLTLADGSAFPLRNFILFTTFVVILSTLVLQGISLAPLIRTLQFPRDEAHAGDRDLERRLRARMAQAVVAHLDGHYGPELERHEVFSRLRTNYARLEQGLAAAGDNEVAEVADRYKAALIELIGIRRGILRAERCESALDMALVRHMEETLDFEEARIHHTRY